jgi:hypothetical protein
LIKNPVLQFFRWAQQLWLCSSLLGKMDFAVVVAAVVVAVVAASAAGEFASAAEGFCKGIYSDQVWRMEEWGLTRSYCSALPFLQYRCFGSCSNHFAGSLTSADNQQLPEVSCGGAIVVVGLV